MEMLILVLVVGVISYYVALGRAREKEARETAPRQTAARQTAQAPAEVPEAEIHQFCPHCFSELGPGQATCPVCGADVQTWLREHSDTERLIQALQHPDAAARLAATTSLGNRRAVEAAQPLAESALAHPEDVVQGLEAVVSLARLPHGPERDQALDRLEEHPAEAVRAAAWAIAGKDEPAGRRFYFMD